MSSHVESTPPRRRLVFAGPINIHSPSHDCANIKANNLFLRAGLAGAQTNTVYSAQGASELSTASDSTSGLHVVVLCVCNQHLTSDGQ
jgi:hypothetical protein